jgi:tetratricopeptide (TPR) repeat protein
MAQQKPREAVDLIDQILERHSKLSGADMLEYAAGLAWRQAEDRAAAMERFERVCRDFPQSRWAEAALKFRVQLAFETGDFEQARALADSFLATYTHSVHRPLVLQYRGRTDTRLRRYQSAEATFRELLKSAPPSKTAGSDVPAPAMHRFYLAEAQVARGAYAAGLETLAAARRSGLPGELAADAVACEAAGMIGLKHPEQAIALLSLWLKAHGKQPDASVCRTQLALAQAAAGKWQAALAGLNQWYSSDPSEPQSLLTLNSVGELAYRQGKFPEALKCYDRLSASDVPDAYRMDGLAGAALTRFAMGNHARSATSWEQLLREYPSYPLAAEASLRRAKSLEAAGDNAGALAAYRQTATKFPQTREAPEALVAAAKLAMHHDALDEAVECYRELVDGFAEYPQRDAALAEWAAALDNAQQAEAADEVWLRLEQEYPRSRYAQEAIARSAEVAVKRNAPEAADLVARLEASANDENARRRVIYLQGKLAAQAEDWPRVEKLMQQVVDASTASEYRLEAAYWLAEAAFRQEQWEVAQQRFELLAADRGSRDDAWLARVPLRQAQLLLRQGEYAAARQTLAGLLAQPADDDSPAQSAAKQLIAEVETAERQASGEETRTAAESGRPLR